MELEIREHHRRYEFFFSHRMWMLEISKKTVTMYEKKMLSKSNKNIWGMREHLHNLNVLYNKHHNYKFSTDRQQQIFYFLATTTYFRLQKHGSFSIARARHIPKQWTAQLGIVVIRNIYFCLTVDMNFTLLWNELDDHHTILSVLD